MAMGTAPGGYLFEPVEASGLSQWRRPTRFAAVEQAGVVPIADTELLNLSHHCPVAVQIEDGAPRVVCMLRSSALRARRIGRDGRWLLGYVPLALRTLPFRARSQRGQRIVEIASDLAANVDGAEPQPLFTKSGAPSRDYAAVLGMLDVLLRGSARLSNAARMLIAADVLVPLSGEIGADNLLVASAELLFQLPPARAAALTADGCLAFDLAAACIFSQRWLAEGVVERRPVEAEIVPVIARDTMLDHGLRDAIDQPIGLDDSPLFSFDAFVAHGAVDERA